MLDYCVDGVVLLFVLMRLLMMRIVILGVGVMGLLFGVWLVESGEVVMLIDVNDVYFDVICCDGLCIDDDCGEWCICML